MDDLLALMEEDDNVPEPPAPSDSEDEKEDILPAPSERQRQMQETLASSADNKIGIRMINRKLSGAELMDVLASNPYHSPATLSAMSLSELNTKVLVQAATIVDAATVCGRTQFVTAGLVFSNSGTRTSSTGNAFCILTIGNLATGPAVSLLLFGSSYSKFVKTATPGKVVLLQQPRLIPRKQNSRDSATSITFTVNDERQMQIVADARDFGICKGKIRGKDPQTGQWVSDAKRCHRHVDTRVGCYCKTHQNQGKTQHLGKNNNMNKMDQLRSQAQAFPTQGSKRSLTLPPMSRQLQRPANHHIMSLPNQGQQGNQRMMTMQQHVAKNSASLKPTVPLKHNTSKNALLNPYRQTQLSKPALVLPKKTVPLVTPRRSAPTLMSTRETTRQKAELTLTQPRKRQRCVVNTDTRGFNGSVAIPKPKQFGGRLPQGLSHQPRAQRAPLQRTREDILLQQKQAAEQLLRGGGGAATNSKPLVAKKATRSGAVPSNSINRQDLLYGTLGTVDREKVVTTKSRFAKEAQAEEYARARHAMLELESDEAKKLAKEERKSKNPAANAKIQKAWRCVTCKKTFPMQPTKCIRANHDVRVKRELEQKKSTAEKRLQLSSKSVDDGGMTLGTGIEWCNGYR